MLLLLVLFTSLIAPNLVSMRNGQRQRAAYGQVTDLISEARLSAVGNDLTYAITWDSGTSKFSLKKEPPNTDTNDASSIPQPEARPLQSATSVDQFVEVKDVSIPAPLQIQNFRQGTNNSDSGSWALHFYPDGTSDGGGLEIHAGSDVRSVVVDKYGLSTLSAGALPDESNVIWTAGTYAQKI